MSDLLDVRSISVAYGSRVVLRDVSLKLREREVVALIGPNGAGKSTLIRALLGIVRATGGIVWQNQLLHSWSRRRLARLVAYLPQSPLHEPGQRVIDVLRLGRSPYWRLFGLESPRDEEVVREIASQLRLADLLNRPMEEISGGQRQMVFLARALIQEPRAILLDEPNTFLDLRHQVELMSLLRNLAKEQNVAVLMASHDLNLAASLSDRLVLLDNGTVAASGSADVVLDPDLIERVYGVAMQRVKLPDGAAALLPKIAP
jgi:iron complex transport system ATP-binding protein